MSELHELGRARMLEDRLEEARARAEKAEAEVERLKEKDETWRVSYNTLEKLVKDFQATITTLTAERDELRGIIDGDRRRAQAEIDRLKGLAREIADEYLLHTKGIDACHKHAQRVREIEGEK